MTTHEHTEHGAAPARLDSLLDVEGAPLSASGLNRRRAIGARAAGAVRARGRKRRAAQAGLCAAALALVVGAVVVVGDSGGAGALSGPSGAGGAGTVVAGGDDGSDAAPSGESEASRSNAGAAPVRAGYVGNDSLAVERYGVADGPVAVKLIDDAEVLAELRAAGLSAGLVRTESRTRLAFHDAPAEGPALP